MPTNVLGTELRCCCRDPITGFYLVTPMPEWGFPGLQPGDRWCVCVTRWKAALERGRAAPIDLEATHSSVLEFVDLEDLKAHAVKG
jgi:uncharacterized protein (DUF2237 family)